MVRTTWAEVDVIGFCLPANEKLGPGDRFIAKELAAIRKTPKVAIVTKTDLVDSKTLAEQLIAIDQLGTELGIAWAEIVPASATAGQQVDLLADLLIPLLPESPALYPEGDLTDEPEQVMVAELIREARAGGRARRAAALHRRGGGGDAAPRGPPRRQAAAGHPRQRLHRAPQPEGHHHRPQGQALKEVGIRSRKQIEALLGTPVFLDLHVKVAKDWQRDPKQLRKLGF
ncbi:GTPase Era OS=Streptomyces fumanus OX=67302 GN=era PE=3 SV=1 [Streptomyces fumanus]